LHDPAHPAGTKRKLNCPNVHAAPEVIFDDLASPSSDIWAMGNTMHQILTGGGLEGLTFIPGAEHCSKDDGVAETVRILGKLPETWWSRWEARSKHYDEEGRLTGEMKTNNPRESLGSRISAFYLPDE
jgi:serine/threonine-protein kinase SRPK3